MMRSNALFLSLIMLLVPLAGCSGTDTEVTVDMNSEDLQNIIDDNRDDFLNNTTVVVFQDYHNNTTVVNNYSNNTTNNLDQSGASTSSTTYNYNGSNNDSSNIFVSHITWKMLDVFPNFTSQMDNWFTVYYTYYDYATNDDRTDIFSRPCSEFYDIPLGYLPSDWYDNGTTNRSIWGNSQYGSGSMSDFYWNYWDDQYNNTIRNMLDEARSASFVQDVCRHSYLVIEDDYYQGSTYVGYNHSSNQDDYIHHDRRDERYIFHQIELEEGTSIRVIQINMVHAYTYYSNEHGGDGGGGWSSYQISNGFNWYVVDQLGERSGNSMMSGYYGGWQDLTLSFALHENVWIDSEFEMIIYYELIPVTNV